MLVLLVVAAAATGIRLAGIAAALTAAAGFDFFLTAPYHTFAIADPDDIETAVLLLLVERRGRRDRHLGTPAAAQASREQGYLDGLLGTAADGRRRAVLHGRAHRPGRARRSLTSAADRQYAASTRPPTTGCPTLADDGTLARGGRTIDIARRGLPTDAATALPVRSGGTVYGHYLLTSSTRVARPSRNQLRVAVMLADQVGAALAGHSSQQPGDPT